MIVSCCLFMGLVMGEVMNDCVAVHEKKIMRSHDILKYASQLFHAEKYVVSCGAFSGIKY
jgi:hypothetical protein